MDLDDEELKATRRMNGSDKNVACMGRNIKLVENLIEEYKLYGDLDGIQDLKPYMESLEHLIKAYKELKEEIRQFYNGEIYTAKQLKQLEENQNKYFINKEVIKENLEELREQYKIALEENSIKAVILKCQIQAFEELLEKRKYE